MRCIFLRVILPRVSSTCCHHMQNTSCFMESLLHASFCLSVQQNGMLEWFHMRQIAVMPVHEIEESVLDHDTMAAFTKLQAEKQNRTNLLHAILSSSKTRKWELRHDSASANAQLLTSGLHATIAGIPGSILLDTGAQENFLFYKFCGKTWSSIHRAFRCWKYSTGQRCLCFYPWQGNLEPLNPTVSYKNLYVCHRN